MRHWNPYIREVMPQIVADGVDRLVAAVMAPHYSRMSVGRYMQRVDEALTAANAAIPVLQIESWKDDSIDIGRVAISTGIWDKTDALTDLEREKIRLHTYVGERVLARAPSLQ